MARAEFGKPVKRDALKRAGGLCEADGAWYGLLPGQRCNAPLSFGVEFDHIILEANSHDNSPGIARRFVPVAMPIKPVITTPPAAAKTVRQRDKSDGITKAKHKWAKRTFAMQRGQR